MTFYQELQLNQAGSKNLLNKSETVKEKLYHMLVYLVKIAVTMIFCFFFVTVFSILFGNENSIVGVVVLLCLMVFRNADLGIHAGQSTMLLALFFVIMTVCPHLANLLSPVPGMLLNTNLESEKGFQFFQNFLKENGILEQLEALGVKDGDTIRMYGLQFDYYK